jgi:hypothetical protein
MKIFLAIYLLTCGLGTSQTLDEIAVTVDLGTILPENYDWAAYIKAGESTTDEKMRAYSGIKIMKPRLELLLADIRTILKNNVEGLKEFEKMHLLWKQSADIEVNWIAKSRAGGSQQKAEIPKARLRTLVMRFQYLKRFKDESGLFNQ